MEGFPSFFSDFKELDNSGLESQVGTISSERICPTTIAHGKTLSNPQNDCLENLFQILFTNHGLTSDSWTKIGLRRNFAAKTTGKATYHHLQKTTSALDFRR
jgi:hypothetical protein